MKKLEDIKLFTDLNKVSLRYKELNINLKKNDITINDELQKKLTYYKNNIDLIKNRANLISNQSRNLAKNSTPSEIINTIEDLNRFSFEKYTSILNDKNKECLPIQTILDITLEELILINNSINNKEFLEDKFTYFYIYEKVVINSFLTFLALKDIDFNKEKIEKLSQGVLSQIQCLSLISI